MKLQKRRAFIINFLYFLILTALVLLLVKYILPLFAPFLIAFLIAYFVRKPAYFLSERLHLNYKLAVSLFLLLFYGSIGLLLTLSGIKLLTAIRDFTIELPAVYTAYIQPILTDLFDTIEQSVFPIDASLVSSLEELEGQLIQSVGNIVSRLSLSAMSSVSGLASSLPGTFIRILITVISSFFIAMDYDLLLRFCLKQFSTETRAFFWHIKEYVVGTLLVCIRSYVIIMSLTFVELSIGLSLCGISNALLIAAMISVFDILPVLGCGGIMIPWTIIAALQGNYPLAIKLLIVYLVITVIRNILEPKIVGSQIGLHPIVTLIGIFVGAQLFGVIGLFAFPIIFSLLRHLNETGVIHLFKT